MLTEKEAWLRIAKEFERYHKKGYTPKTIAYNGLCSAVDALTTMGEVSFNVRRRMLFRIKEFMSTPSFDNQLCFLWPPRREWAINRQHLALLFAEKCSKSGALAKSAASGESI